MRRQYVLLLIVALSLAQAFNAIAGDRGLVHFIFCSDVHYGLHRELRGEVLGSDSVSRIMLKAFKLLETTEIPDKGGVCGGEEFGSPDFIVCGGDIANRMEKGVQTATRSWEEFCRDWTTTLSAPLYLLPGNHDLSNAVGYTKPLSPATDAASAMGIYNEMVRPGKAVTKDSFDIRHDKVRYSFVKDNVRFAFLGLWPDAETRDWLDREIDGDSLTPVVVFAHVHPAPETKHFINPNAPHDINPKDKFQNLLNDTCGVSSIDVPDTVNTAKLERFVKTHPTIAAYFHGHTNYNEFYTWTGVNGTIALPVFRVDSPMKGETSATDERRLSFQAVVIDTETQMMTVRECLWNAELADGITWGEETTVPLKRLK